MFRGLKPVPIEIEQHSTLTRLPKVMIDRVRVESVITLQNETYHTVMASRHGSDEWYQVAKPSRDLETAWQTKLAIEAKIREENIRMSTKISPQETACGLGPDIYQEGQDRYYSGLFGGMQVDCPNLNKAIAEAKGEACAIGMILLEVGKLSEEAAELIEQDLTVPEMSLKGCAAALKAYAKKHQSGGCWACPVFGIDPENEAIKVILDFYKIPSAWVAKEEPAPEPVQKTEPGGVIDLFDLL